MFLGLGTDRLPQTGLGYDVSILAGTVSLHFSIVVQAEIRGGKCLKSSYRFKITISALPGYLHSLPVTQSAKYFNKSGGSYIK